MNLRKYNYLIYVFAFLLLIAFVAFGSNYIDSDMASEMIIAKMCADSKSLLLKDWFYSTEIRLFNMNLPLSIMFLITSNCSEPLEGNS